MAPPRALITAAAADLLHRAAGQARRVDVPPVRRLLRRVVADVLPRRRLHRRRPRRPAGRARRRGAGVPVWISGPQFEAWKHTQLVIDVVPGRGGGFSLEAPEGVRFLSRGRAFTDDENRVAGGQPAGDGCRLRAGGAATVDGDAHRRRGRRRLPDTWWRAARLSRVRALRGVIVEGVIPYRGRGC